MKRILKTVCIFLLFFSLFGINVFGAQTESYSEMISSLSDEAVDILSSVGITQISYESVFSVSIAKVFQVLLDVFAGSLKKPLASALVTVGLLAVISAFSSVLKTRETAECVGSAVITLFLSADVIAAVNGAVSVGQALSSFTTVFLGIFCALISSGGGVASAVSYEATAVFSNTVLAFLSSELSVSLSRGLCATAFLSSMNVFSLPQKVSALIKRLYITVLGLFTTVYSGVYSAKTVLASAGDSVASKGLRFLIGKSVPVVGSTVSESFLSLVEGMKLIKSTVGVFGILSVSATVLPIVLQLAAWLVAFEITVTASELFLCHCASTALSVMKDVTVLLLATVIFEAVIFIVSVGIVLTFA